MKKKERDAWTRKHLLDLAYQLGVVRIVTKRRQLPAIRKMGEVDSFMTTYQAYELVDDRA